MINCYNSEFKGNILRCAVTGEKCNPRLCQGCNRLNTAKFYTEISAANELLNYCKKNCSEYYECDKMIELQIILGKH